MGSFARYFIAIVFVSIGCAANAKPSQVIADSTTIAAIQRINAIKLDPEHYLSEECTADDWMSAYETAKILLKDKIKRWLTDQEIDNVVTYVAKSDEKFLQIKDQSGSMYRAFVYVKKEDILVFGEDRKLLIDKVAKEEQASKESKDEKPQEAKEGESAATEEKESVNSEEKKELASEGKTEDIVLMEKAEDSVLEDKAELPQVETVQSQPEVVSVSTDALSMEMFKVVDYEGVKNFIKEKEKKGFLTRMDYGQYATHPSVGTYYMFMYNRQYEVTGYIKVTNGELINLKTGKLDDVKNYKGCAAFWFRMLK